MVSAGAILADFTPGIGQSLRVKQKSLSPISVAAGSFHLPGGHFIGSCWRFCLSLCAAASHWVFDGCVMYRTEGIWSENRVKEKLQAAHEQYEQLTCGFRRCRLLNPLTLDLANCGPRARCKGQRVDSLRFFSWMQHVQVTFHCGGFCQPEVPIFGLTTMKETLEERPACVDAIVELLQIAGKGFGATAVVLAVPMAFMAIRLACVASEEKGSSSGSEAAPLTRRGTGHRGHRSARAYPDEDDSL